MIVLDTNVVSKPSMSIMIARIDADRYRDDRPLGRARQRGIFLRVVE